LPGELPGGELLEGGSAMTSRQCTPANPLFSECAAVAKAGTGPSVFHGPAARRDYNILVTAQAPSKARTPGADMNKANSSNPDLANRDAAQHRSDDTHRHHHAAYAAEASGLLVIAVLLLILVLIRYWHYIAWSAR
jgi:hypothetical protein